MNWLCLYHEARTDRKLQTLSDAQFRVWFNLLCFAGEQPERGTIAAENPYLLAVEVAQGDAALLADTLDRLAKLDIVRIDGPRIVFIHFAERQYAKPSDRPERVADRVQRHRERQRAAEVEPDATPGDAEADPVTPSNAESGDETRCNADVTPRNALHRHIQEQEIPPKSPTGDEYPAEFAAFWSAYPNKKAKGDAYQVWRRLKPRPGLVVLLAALERQRASPEWVKDGGRYIPHPATWLRRGQWEDEVGAPPGVNGNGVIDWGDPAQVEAYRRRREQENLARLV